MGLTFRDLENFVTVAESRTLSEASEKLGMAQPSLSLGIKKLEGEMGTSLFIRGRDGIKLTPQGKSLLPKAIESLKLLTQIKGGQPTIRFKIGCHASVGIFILGPFFKAMYQLNPLIDFEIVNSSSNEINRMVSAGEVDFGLVMNPLPIQGLVTKIIGEDHVHVWESKTRYNDKLIFNPSMVQASSIIRRWKKAPSARIEVQNLELVAKLVSNGVGVGVLPTQVVLAQNVGLKIVPNTPSFTDKLALVCYPEMIQSTEGKLVFEALKGSFSPQAM